MKYYFRLTDGTKYTFYDFIYAKQFYEDNKADIVETNFN